MHAARPRLASPALYKASPLARSAFSGPAGAAFAGSAAKAGFTKDKPKAMTKVLNVTENV
jgi:hypothetical protein